METLRVSESFAMGPRQERNAPRKFVRDTLEAYEACRYTVFAWNMPLG